MSLYVEIYSSDCKIVFQILDTPQVEQIHGQYIVITTFFEPPYCSWIIALPVCRRRTLYIKRLIHARLFFFSSVLSRFMLSFSFSCPLWFVVVVWLLICWRVFHCNPCSLYVGRLSSESFLINLWARVPYVGSSLALQRFSCRIIKLSGMFTVLIRNPSWGE